MEEVKNKEPSSEDLDQTFLPLVVLEFSTEVPPNTVEWLYEKIIAPRTLGGAELLAKIHNDGNDESQTLHLSGETERLLMAAELMQMKKPYRDGSLREISVSDIELFKGSDDLDTMLTMADKQEIILHELESIRASKEDEYVAGIPKIKLYEGEVIVPRCRSERIITKLFPLHCKKDLATLSTEWYKKFFSPQPISAIEKYFGSTIAMYFSFLGFYTMALIPPAFIGVISALVGYNNMNTQIFFCFFNLIWSTLFLEAWKRNCGTLAYQWGTYDMPQFEEARAEYYGVLSRNQVTGRLEPKYPKWKRALKFYGVSVPFVMLCLLIAFGIMLVYFHLEEWAIEYDKATETILSEIGIYIPSTIYAVVIIVMNGIYRKMAKMLNDWENHRLQTAYDNHLIVKLVLFDFANCFMSLFYIAFYYQDMFMLRMSLAILLIVQQVIGQVQETLVPYIMYKLRKQKVSTLESGTGTDAEKISEEAPLLDNAAAVGIIKDEYPGTLDDYLEMFLQFGYVFLFSAVFPSAALWALLNNIFEIRSDGFKLCRVFQRPFARPAANIGAWQLAFELLSAVAVVTNCALVYLSPHVQVYSESLGAVGLVLLFVIAEHILLFTKMTIAYIVPDLPHWVETALDRVEFESKQAWKKQKAASAERLLRKRSSQLQTTQDSEDTLSGLHQRKATQHQE